MEFNSAQFVTFFAVVVAMYFRLPHRYRWAVLLAASYYFYMSWKPIYGLLILASTVVDYVTGLLMGRQSTRRQRRPYLIASLMINLGLLLTFKYLGFFQISLDSVLSRFGLASQLPYFHVLLPIGISFYTFQTLSYAIDVYRGDRPPERHFGIFALYVAFFPQLVAGPIERSTRLLPQLRQPISFDYDRCASGLRLMVWGYFKKVVVADRVAVLVYQIYNHVGEYTGLPLWFGTYAFAFQIYCDFSGYSDIAIGAARVMGYDLMQNFRRPYAAKSLAEFWQRWHISLSTWFRDYLYIPLGGSRVSQVRWHTNLLVVFLLSGLWHGANWTFVLWGAFHGVLLMASTRCAAMRERMVQFSRLDRYPTVRRAIRVVVTFHLVCFGWIFFRANSLADALYIITHLFDGVGEQLALAVHWSWHGQLWGPYYLALERIECIIAVFAIIVLEWVHLQQERHGDGAWMARNPRWVRWSAYYGLIAVIILFGMDGSNQFIYFRF